MRGGGTVMKGSITYSELHPRMTEDLVCEIQIIIALMTTTLWWIRARISLLSPLYDSDHSPSMLNLRLHRALSPLAVVSSSNPTPQTRVKLPSTNSNFF